MDKDKKIFTLGVYMGMQLRDKYLAEHEEIEKKYMNVLEWECEQIDEMYTRSRKDLPEYFTETELED